MGDSEFNIWRNSLVPTVYFSCACLKLPDTCFLHNKVFHLTAGLPFLFLPLRLGGGGNASLQRGEVLFSRTFYLLQSVVYNKGSYSTCPGEYLTDIKYHS